MNSTLEKRLSTFQDPKFNDPFASSYSCSLLFNACLISRFTSGVFFDCFCTLPREMRSLSALDRDI